MLKKTITFNDFNGKAVTKEFWFHLSKAELIELEVSFDNGLSEYINKLIADGNNRGVVKLVKEFIARAYGVKSEDGLRFIKTEENLAKFMESEAYSVLFCELLENEAEAVAFMTGIAPATQKPLTSSMSN